jgi:deazaflavin-dependent oxidoreductase (nitroreductase family)
MHRWVRTVAASRPLSWISARMLHHIDRFVNRHSTGRLTFSSWVSGLPVVMLTTRGARTGMRRTVPLVGICDGSALIVIASNFGGTRNQGWYHNLRSHPRASVTVRGTTWDVMAREIDGAEREWFFQQGVHMHPGWALYRRRAAGRRIPVIRLEPTSGSTLSA